MNSKTAKKLRKLLRVAVDKEMEQIGEFKELVRTSPFKKRLKMGIKIILGRF